MKPLSAWPRQPFLGLAISATIGILIADRWPDCSVNVIGVIAALAAAAWFSRQSLVIYGLIALGFFFLHSARTTDTPGLVLARSLGEGPQPVTVRGAVISEPRGSERGAASFLLEAESIEIEGATRPCRAKFFVRWRQPVEFGDDVRLFGTAQKIEGPRNPGEFDMRAYLAREDVHRALIVRYAENGMVLSHGGGNRLLRAAQKSRGWMEATLRNGLENSPDVTSSINGMVLGLRHQTAEDIEEPFQQTGTLHLFAVAGLHVGIVARLLWILATMARLPRKWATALIIPLLLFYSAITGLHTSSVRAAVMSAVLRLAASSWNEKRLLLTVSLRQRRSFSGGTRTNCSRSAFNSRSASWPRFSSCRNLAFVSCAGGSKRIRFCRGLCSLGGGAR
jgi:predicted membrane metal-binding protein